MNELCSYLINGNNCLINKNIPCKLSFYTRAKEWVHNIFRNPKIVEIFTHLPNTKFLSLNKHKNLALLITKCHKTFDDVEHNTPITAIYGGDKLKTLKALQIKHNHLIKKKDSTQITFTTNDSLTAGRELRKLAGERRIGLLNMANRWQPGGVGMAPYGGSQEEYLIRRSNLYFSVNPHLNKNLENQFKSMRLKEGYDSSLPTHHIPAFGTVVSKDVTFIDQAEWDQFDIISAAAPDLRKGSDESIYLKRHFNKDISKLAQGELIKHKIEAIFSSAIEAGITDLVLGAFGCGCFKNSPESVSKIFKEVLEDPKYRNSFTNIVFAITDLDKKEIFEKAFS